MRGLIITEIPNDPNIIDLDVSPSQHARSLRVHEQSTQSHHQTNATLDWRANGRVTPAKNQGYCGACWAFSTVAFFESEAIRTGGASNAVDLSEQYFLKCDTRSGGCWGGNAVTSTLLSIERGLPLESAYPYSPHHDYQGICSAQSAYTFGGSRLAFHYGNKLSDEQIINYLQTRPIIVFLTATYWYMYDFKRSRTFQCRPQESQSMNTINNGVLLVGQTETQWIVKNSWGPGYGDAGYIYISRKPSANCGIGFFISTLA